jgi:hypothetical protein
MVSVRPESFNTDVAFVFIGILNMLIQIWTNDLIALAHSERVSTSSFFSAWSIFLHSISLSPYVVLSVVFPIHGIMDI